MLNTTAPRILYLSWQVIANLSKLSSLAAHSWPGNIVLVLPAHFDGRYLEVGVRPSGMPRRQSLKLMREEGSDLLLVSAGFVLAKLPHLVEFLGLEVDLVTGRADLLDRELLIKFLKG